MGGEVGRYSEGGTPFRWIGMLADLLGGLKGKGKPRVPQWSNYLNGKVRVPCFVGSIRLGFEGQAKGASSKTSSYVYAVSFRWAAVVASYRRACSQRLSLTNDSSEKAHAHAQICQKSQTHRVARERVQRHGGDVKKGSFLVPVGQCEHFQPITSFWSRIQPTSTK